MIRKVLVTALFLGLTGSSIHWMTSTAQGGFRELYLPYWTADGSTQTVVFVNNPNLDYYDLLFTLYSSRGGVVSEHLFTLGPNESRSLDVRALVGRKASSGYAVLTYPSELPLLPAQALISTGLGGVVLDFEDERNLDFASGNRHAIGAGFAGRADRRVVKVALTNLGDTAQAGVLSVNGARGYQRRWSVPAGAVRVFTVSARDVGASDTLTASIDTHGDDRHLLVSGMVEHASGQLQPFHFQGGVRESSGELAGFYDSPAARLQFWNLDDEPLVANVVAHGEGGAQEAQIPALPGEAVSVSLAELVQLDQDGGALALNIPPDHRVIAQLIGADGAEVTLKDTTKETNLAYSFPVRFADTLSSRLKVFNPNNTRVDLCVFLFFDGQNYTYPLKELGPYEFAEIDLLEARDTGLLGELGGVIPEDAEVGQAKITLHSEGELKNLVMMGQFVDLDTQIAINLQGCFGCPAALLSIVITPGSFEKFGGHEQNYDVIATYQDTATKIISSQNMTGPSSVTTTNSAIAHIDGDKVVFNAAGTTTMIATLVDCVQATAGGEPGTRLGCGCLSYGQRSDTASVTSKSTQFELAITGFIPDNSVDPFSPEAFCNTGPPFLITRETIFKGDDRGFVQTLSPTDSFRVRHRVVIDTNPNAQSELVSEARQIGESRSYADNALDDDQRIGPSDEDGVPNDCHLWHDKATASASGLSVVAENQGNNLLGPNPFKVVTDFTGDADLPLLLIDPNINWQFQIAIDTSGDEATYSLNGLWDGYPNLEIHINGNLITQFNIGASSPNCLFPVICDTVMAKSGTLP